MGLGSRYNDWMRSWNTFLQEECFAESLASLYTSAESNLRDRVLSEIEKVGFNVLTDKGRYTKLLL